VNKCGEATNGAEWKNILIYTKIIQNKCVIVQKYYKKIYEDIKMLRDRYKPIPLKLPKE